MTVTATRDDVSLVADVVAALAGVTDPENDRPITQLGLVCSVRVDGTDAEVHIRIPAGFSSPDFAYLVASDASDALHDVDGIGEAVVVLDDHHDSAVINGGLAGEPTTRDRYLRIAHAAAVRRCVTDALLRKLLDTSMIHHLMLRDLPPGRAKTALLRRRVDMGLSVCPNSRVLLDTDQPTQLRED